VSLSVIFSVVSQDVDRFRSFVIVTGAGENIGRFKDDASEQVVLVGTRNADVMICRVGGRRLDMWHECRAHIR
jgi:hypothetical protein